LERFERGYKKQEELDTKLKSSVLDNPAGNYEHLMEVDHGYTYYKSYYFTSGQNVKFHTVSNNADPIMYLYRSISSLLTPGSNSWFNDDGMYYSLDSKIEVTIPQTGYYTVLLASYNQNSFGITDLYKDDVLVGNDVPVGGVQIACSLNKTGNLNFFTSEVEFGYEDTYMIVSENNYGPAKAFNDNYSESSNFPWYTASRIKGNFPNRIRKVLITSNHSTSAGTCDVYMNCENSNITSWFPNLKPEDAIQSAPASGVYNCISWSGGITNDWYWPPSPIYGGQYYIEGDPLGSFDNFYGNTPSARYGGATSYTRSGVVNYSHICIDLWAKDGSYTHGSVRKPGNNHPHGYDWESKPGGLMRTFHPRHSLNGSNYGSVVDYYRPVSNLKSSMLLDESIARGLSVIENVELTTNEKLEVTESIAKLSLKSQSDLQNKYELWRETWENSDVKVHSNPRMYANSQEYEDLITYCKSMGEKSWPFIFDKIEKGDFFAINALEDLTLENNIEVLEKVKKDNSLKSSTTSGVTIVRTPQAFAMKYIKELLKSTREVTSTGDEGIVYSNSFDFNIYPNPVNDKSQIVFDLPYDANVSIEAIDLTGKALSIPQSNHFLTQGKYNYSLNVPESFMGNCIVKLCINNNVNAKLLVVE